MTEIISVNAHLNRQMHRYVQVEQFGDAPQKYLFPFTLAIEPFSYKEYYFSKYRNVNNLFYSFPTEISSNAVISDRVILVRSESESQLTRLDHLLDHNRKYLHNWSIRLLRHCIESARMISTERLRQFLGQIRDPEIDQFINQLEKVYQQHQSETEYYADLERKKQARMFRRFSYIASILLAIFTLLQGLPALQWLIDIL